MPKDAVLPLATKQRHRKIQLLEKNPLHAGQSTLITQGILNIHNMHHWAQENPRVTKESSFQRIFHTNVWAGV